MALDDNTVITGVDLVEAAYNKGTWTLRKVATINDNLTDHPVIAPVTASFLGCTHTGKRKFRTMGTI
ncbi:MAG: hypothetical protein IPK11_09505 [Ignavibacteria bacterium]|nr:hypothetical protein [Ignavibacteria bacterium]